MNIIFIDRFNYHANRATFYNLLKNDYQMSVIEDLAQDNDYKIIFWHTSHRCNIPDLLNNNQLINSVVVKYGNNQTTNPLTIENTTVSYVNFGDIENNFAKFYERIQNKTVLDNEDWNTLIGRDSKLESYLTPFTSYDPFTMTDENRKDLTNDLKALKKHEADFLSKNVGK